MGRSLIPYFLRSIKLTISGKGGFAIILLFFLLSQILYAQDGIKIDSLKPTITLKSGAEIFSGDEIFNQQVLNNKVIVENSTISYVQNKKVLKLHVAQPIARNKNLSENITLSRNKDKNPLKCITKAIKSNAARKDNINKYKFESNSSTNKHFLNTCVSRDCINIDFSNFKTSKISSLKPDFSVKLALNDLHCKLFYFYSSTSLSNCFSKIYSVRPPPMI